MKAKIKTGLQLIAFTAVGVFLIACSYNDTAKALKAAQKAVKSRTQADIVDATIHNNTNLRFKIINTPLLNLSFEERQDSAKALAIYAKNLLNANFEKMTDSYDKIVIAIYKGGRYNVAPGMGLTVGNGDKFEFVLKDL